MSTHRIAVLAVISLIGLALCQRAFSQTVSMESPTIDTVIPSPLTTPKYYLTDIPNLAPAGGIAANPGIDETNTQTKAAEKLLLDNPPKLRAFVWTPVGTPPAGGWPAVVMMSGHTGIYSTGVTASQVGTYSKLSNRSKLWGEYWQSQGFVAVLMDDFGAYGFHAGFTVDWSKRPGWASGASARPYYALSGISVVSARFGHVNPNQIVLMGWSNGGTATLSTIAAKGAPRPNTYSRSSGFRAALALYPGCGMENRYAIPNNGVGGYDASIPVHVINAGADTEVDITVCDPKLLNVVQAKGNRMTSETMAGATHTFDANNATANANADNVTARDHALAYALTFFKAKLGINP